MSELCQIVDVDESNRDRIREIVKTWLADFIITRGRKVYPAELPAFIAVDSTDRVVGLATYEIFDDQCELVTLDAFDQWQGIGTLLLKAVREVAAEAGCLRLWLITTNDNVDAIRFYQKRDFTIAAVHVNALEYSRQLKPVIPTIGNYDIPMRDEIEFEMFLRD